MNLCAREYARLSAFGQCGTILARVKWPVPMVQMHEIQSVSDQIAREFRPERIVLFGSFADGSATANSDVDLLVVMPFEGTSARMAAAIVNQVNPEIPVELLVRTPEQLQKRLAWNDFFFQEVLDKGTTLYAADHRGIDRQGGG